jgi:sulfatase modifying factor 1
MSRRFWFVMVVGMGLSSATGLSLMTCNCGNSSDATADSALSDTGSESDAVAADRDVLADLPEDGSSGCVHPPVVRGCDAGWCRIPAGCFRMGSPPDEFARAPDNENAVLVTLTHEFFIQQHETTVEEWSAMGVPRATGSDPKAACSDARCPIGFVTWYDALNYANAMSRAHTPPLPECYRLEGCTTPSGEGMRCTTASIIGGDPYECAGFRLPTEAEWEYAARAGTTTAFYSGDIMPGPATCYLDKNLDKIAWYCGNSDVQTHPVEGKEPNGWGLFDMSGNVDEWVADCYNDWGYGTAPAVNPYYTGKPDYRVTRSGQVIDRSPHVRSASRGNERPEWTFSRVGFRLARTLSPRADAGLPDAPGAETGDDALGDADVSDSADGG